jgi:predicted transcriptional regulator
MESVKISPHEVAVFKALTADRWVTVAEVAKQADVARRTAQNHLAKLLAQNIVERVEVFPAFRYRRATDAEERNREYVDRLTEAAEAFTP